MKNIVRYLLIVVIGGMLFSACEEPVNNYDLMTKDFDKNNPTFYVQLTTPTGNFETAIDENGQPKNIVRTIGVILLGAPQPSDVTITLSKNNSSTISDNAWSLASPTIVIPAGSTSGSTTLTVLASEMVEDEVVTLVLDMDVAGGEKAPMANQVNYNLKRIKFCPWAVDDMVGSYSGTDVGWYDGGIYNASFTITKVDESTIKVSGIGSGQYSGGWGETVTAGDEIVMTVNPNGTLSFENQYMAQTDGQWDYYMGPGGGTAKWDGCNQAFNIPYYAHWDASYGDNMPGHAIFSK